MYEISCVSHLFCRIEAAEMKHNREWEEDWGAKDRPKSPKSPSPAPPEKKTSPSPKAKSSRKDTWKKLHPEVHESFISLFFWNDRVVEVTLSWVQPYFLFHACSVSLSVTPVCCAAFCGLSSKTMKPAPSQRKTKRRKSRMKKWVSAVIVTAVVPGCSCRPLHTQTSARFPLTAISASVKIHFASFGFQEEFAELKTN